MKNEISNQLNKQLNENRVQNEKNIAHIKKTHKAEVKAWRKELGEERKDKIKVNERLEKVLNEKLDNSIGRKPKEPKTSLDNPLMADYSDSELSSCSHEIQCVVRQLYPPPSPLSPFLIHEVSQYHVHMMRMTVDNLAGCLKCFSINNENYGCDNCTWLKWWFKWHGDRHGFPDIHPSKYRKYLN